MNKHVAKVQLHAKDFTVTAMHNTKLIGLMAAGTIVSQKFLDFEAIAKRIKPDIDTTGMIFKHQGAIKFVGGIAALHIWGKKMPDMVKWAVLGVMLQGALQEANVLSKGKTGTIGDEDLDQRMLDAAAEIKRGMLEGNVTEEFASSVAGDNVTTEFASSVSGDFLEPSWGGTVSGYGDNW